MLEGGNSEWVRRGRLHGLRRENGKVKPIRKWPIEIEGAGEGALKLAEESNTMAPNEQVSAFREEPINNSPSSVQKCSVSLNFHKFCFTGQKKKTIFRNIFNVVGEDIKKLEPSCIADGNVK